MILPRILLARTSIVVDIYFSFVADTAGFGFAAFASAVVAFAVAYTTDFVGSLTGSNIDFPDLDNLS